MARKTIYCAQAFWRSRRGLEPGVIHQFLNADRAIQGGKILAAGADGVAVFSLTGEPDVDYWDEPELIATYGSAPGTPGQPAPEPWEAEAA